MQESAGRKPPGTHQPTKVEMEEVVVIDELPNEIATVVLRGGAARRELTVVRDTDPRKVG